MGHASVDLLAGGDASEVILVALSDRAVAALMATSAKLGADAGVAAGPVGVGAEAATANLRTDLISYSGAKGLYAGISLEGGRNAPRRPECSVLRRHGHAPGHPRDSDGDEPAHRPADRGGDAGGRRASAGGGGPVRWRTTGGSMFVRGGNPSTGRIVS
jgi:hypothetical protein